MTTWATFCSRHILSYILLPVDVAQLLALHEL